MKRLLRFFLLVLLLTAVASAQTAVVKRNVNLRPDASTDNAPIATLTPGTQVQLLESDATDGFYHVQTSNGQEGFVWARNVKIQPGSADYGESAAHGSTSGAAGTPLSGQDLLNALVAAKTTAVGQPLIENGETVCGPTGDAKNAHAKALNSNKNRTDMPVDKDYVPIGWDDLMGLPSDRVDDFQGAPITVVGFLSHKVNVENRGSGESTNCHLTGDDEVDWHIYLTKSASQSIADAIIVETTPRTRPSHKWTTDMLRQLVDSPTQVRVSGWLIYDFEHTGVIGTQRATVWEVHPITRIEVQQNGQWVDLDR